MEEKSERKNEGYVDLRLVYILFFVGVDSRVDSVVGVRTLKNYF